MRTVEEIAAKMAALGLWKALEPYNFAVCPRGVAVPYFCSVTLGGTPGVKARFLMLEGWQTLHDYVRVRADRNFGFYSSPMEFPHFELVATESGETKIFRYDTGFMPVELRESQKQLVARILWEAYGIFLRLESEPQLTLSYAEEQAIFARVEEAKGVWKDAPLEIPPPRPHVESVGFPKDLLKSAVDLPLVRDEKLALDFRLLPGLMTRDKPRPRTVYALRAVNAATGVRVFESRLSLPPDGTLRGLWETMPVQVLTGFLALRRVPGEIALVSGRVFRLLRPLCLELPFKLSLHDELPVLEKAFEQGT